MDAGLPKAEDVFAQPSGGADTREISFEVSPDLKWDSALVAFLLDLEEECRKRKINFFQQGLPQAAQKLLAAALKADTKIEPRQKPSEPVFDKIGSGVLRAKEELDSLLVFLGEIALSFGRLFKGKCYFRQDDFSFVLQRCGASALPLVSLISLLVGVILAFVGAIQLRIFGAQIFIADIVGIAMVRVMGAVMTGVLMSGRTGAAFAAELGIMQVNEEIDALKTLGISPVDYLVVPRILALVVMMPLLTLYADLMGILGGFTISSGMLGINPVEYLQHTRTAVKLSNLWVGLTHSFVFGIIIAVAGCLRGMRCERSAAGVGEATTSAVVSAITAIVIATAIITFICQVLGV